MDGPVVNERSERMYGIARDLVHTRRDQPVHADPGRVRGREVDVENVEPGLALASLLVIDALLDTVGRDSEARTSRVHPNVSGLHLRVVQEPCQAGQDDDKGGYHEQTANQETLPEILQSLRMLVGHSAITLSSVFACLKLFVIGMLASCLHAGLAPRRAAFPPCPLIPCQGPLSLKAKRIRRPNAERHAQFRQSFNLGF